MPCHLDIDFGDYIGVIGKLKYPLQKVKMIRMDNELVKITSRVGRNFLEIKFKGEVDETKALFEVQLAGYVEAKNHYLISME
jgi:hypothetical protein